MTGPDTREIVNGDGSFLTEVPLLPVSREQVDKFTPDVITGEQTFNVAEIRDALLAYDRGFVWGADAGRTSVKAVQYVADDGFLYPTGEVMEVPSDGDGALYLDFYRKLGKRAQEQNPKHGGVPVGISAAGNVQGTSLVEVPNVDAFKGAFILHPELQGNFARIVPTLESVDNDAEAAGRFALVYAVQHDYLPKDAQGRSIKMEPGHVELVNPRRHPDQRLPDPPCGFEGRPYVCLENSVSGGAIKYRWYATTGEDIDADMVAGRYRNGTPQEKDWARSLYAASVDGYAEGIAGMGKVAGLLQGVNSTGLILAINGGGYGGYALVVDSAVPDRQRGTLIGFHGGVNREEDYDKRVINKLNKSTLNNINLSPRKSFWTEGVTKYPGAMGAAMGAVVARHRRMGR